jgi:hypothetical protein
LATETIRFKPPAQGIVGGCLAKLLRAKKRCRASRNPLLVNPDLYKYLALSTRISGDLRVRWGGGLMCKFNLTVRDEFRGIVGEEWISKDDLRSTIDLIICD